MICALRLRPGAGEGAVQGGGTRSGFALLAVLWTLTAVTVLTSAAISVGRLGSLTTRNRVLLARAGWAREACGEIRGARYAQGGGVRRLYCVDLGRRTWCRATLEDPSGRPNRTRGGRRSLVTVLRTA